MNDEIAKLSMLSKKTGALDLCLMIMNDNGLSIDVQLRVKKICDKYITQLENNK